MLHFSHVSLKAGQAALDIFLQLTFGKGRLAVGGIGASFCACYISKTFDSGCMGQSIHQMISPDQAKSKKTSVDCIPRVEMCENYPKNDPKKNKINGSYHT